MDTAVLRDILGIIGFGAFFCLLPLSVVGGLFYSLIVKIGQGTAHQKLAQAVGFFPLQQSNDIKNTTYGGLYKGRAFAIRTFSSVSRYYLDGRSRRWFNIKLRIVVAVHASQPLGIKAYRNKSDKIAQKFDEAFIVEGGSLSPAVRDAMLAFSYKGHKTGLRKDLRFGFTRGMRNLSLSDRTNIPDGWIINEALADSKVILTHDHPFVDITPEEFRTILDELDAVAQTIETDRVHPLLAGGTTPPPEGIGKYAYWAFYAFIIAGLPACVCICGMAISFLDAYK